MTTSAYYGEADVGHDVFGERLSLLPEPRPAKLEITCPDVPTRRQEFEAERRAIVNAEDDEFALNKEPEYELGKTLLYVQWSNVLNCVHWLKKMPTDQRGTYQGDLLVLADFLERAAKDIRQLAA